MNKTEHMTYYITKGDHYMDAGDIMRATLEYKNALQLEPKNALSRFSLGKCYIAQKQYLEGLKQFRAAALAIDPGYDQARLEIAHLLLRFNQAQSVLNELAQLTSPGDFEPRRSIISAEAYLNLRKTKKAFDILSHIPDGDQNKEVQRLLTISYRQTGDFERMKVTARQWQTLDPNNIAPYIFLTQHFHQLGQEKQVIKELDNMAKHNSNQPKIKLFRARILEDLGMMEEAKAAFELLTFEPDLLREKASFLLRHGKNEDAEKILRKMLSERPDDTDVVIQLSQLLRSNNDIISAVDLLDKTLAFELDDSDRECILFEKALITYFQGKLKDAKQICLQIIHDNQANVEARFLLGNILFQLEEIEQAEIHLNQVVVSQPENADAQILLAKCQIHNNKNSLAEDTLQRSLGLSPYNLYVRMTLIDLYIYLKDLDRAIGIVEDGLVLIPDEITLLCKRGRIRKQQKDYSRAEDDFKYAVKVQPSSPFGYMEMGHLMYDRSRLDESADWFKRALKQKDGRRLALPALLKICHEKNDLDPMVALIKTCLKETPEAPLIRYYLGVTYMVQGTLEKCERELSTVKRLAPEWSMPYKALAKMYLYQGKTDKALDNLRQAYEKQPALDIGLQLTALYEFCGKWEEWIQIYQDMLKRRGEMPMLLNNLAFFYAEYDPAEERLKEAARMVTRSLSLDPGNALYLDTAAWVAYKQGKLDAAWQYIKQALEISPDEGICNLHAAIISHKRGAIGAALKYLEKATKNHLDPHSREKALSLKKQWDETFKG